MNLTRRLSFLVTTLCALAFLFAATSASAAPKKKEKVVGTVKIGGGATVRINNGTKGNGAVVRCGDVLETSNESAIVSLSSGTDYVIDPATRVKITCNPRTGAVALLVIYGGVHPVGGPAEYIDPLPWLAAFANGNSSFPSIGGVGGRTVSTVLPSGQVIFTTVSN